MNDNNLIIDPTRITDWDKLSEEVGLWAMKNFHNPPDHPHTASQPLRGMIEELGELFIADMNHDIDEVEDAVGDVMIYMADYCYQRKLFLNSIFSHHTHVIRNIVKNVDVIFGVISSMCHHDLKLEQGIRGSQDEHEKMIYMCLDRILCFLGTPEFIARVTRKTWDKVSQRDWNKSKIDGVN